MLSENLTGAVTVYLILKKLMAPFTDWDAYKLHIIDKDGNKLKHPVTSKERDSWDMLTRFCWNLKKISNRFIGKGQFATWFTAAYLLKDSFNYDYLYKNKEKLNETLLADMTFGIQNDLQNLFLKVGHMDYKLGQHFDEDELETLIFKHLNEVEVALKDSNIEKLFVEDGVGVAGSGSTPTMSADIAQHGQKLMQGKNIPFPKLKLKKKKKVITDENN
jgi:hypothetical protein